MAAVTASVLAVGTMLAFTSVARADGPDVTVEVCAFDSTGAALTLGADQAWIQVNGGSIAYVGDVGVSGCRESTVQGGASVATWVAKDGTASSHQVQTAPTNGDPLVFGFYTTNVTIQYPGDVAFGGPDGDYSWFKQSPATTSRQLFANGTPTMFRVDTPAGAVRDVSVSWPEATGPGASSAFSLVAIQVKDNSGAGEAGATARYQNGYWYFAPGATGASGLLAWAVPGLVSTITVEAKVNATTDTQSYDASTQPLLTFQTTKLTLNYNGQVRYIDSGGYLQFFTSPMELFAGTYNFDFLSPSATGNPGSAYTATNITVPAPTSGPVTETAVVVRFQDSTGAGLDGSVSYYLGGWHNAVADTTMQVPWSHTAATIGSPGSAVALFAGAPTNVTFALTYAGGRLQLPAQNIQTSSVAYFHTTAVTVSLRDHTGAPLDQGTASYYASGWHTIGNTTNGNISIELLPGTYAFAMTYAGSREQFSQNVATDPSVLFQTTDVTVSLRDHTGAALDTGTASYYAGGWHTIGATSGGDTSQELLPGTYSFAMTYLGTRNQFSQDIGANPDVVFTTGSVQSTSGNATAYYASGWQPFTQGMELLSGNYTFSFSGAPNAVEPILGGQLNTIP